MSPWWFGVTVLMKKTTVCPNELKLPQQEALIGATLEGNTAAWYFYNLCRGGGLHSISFRYLLTSMSSCWSEHQINKHWHEFNEEDFVMMVKNVILQSVFPGKDQAATGMRGRSVGPSAAVQRCCLVSFDLKKKEDLKTRQWKKKSNRSSCMFH